MTPLQTLSFSVGLSALVGIILYILPIGIGGTLAIDNFIIGVTYLLLSCVVVIAPVRVPWLQRFGVWGLLVGCYVVIFLMGCGMHHLDVATHFFFGVPVINEPEAGMHFLVWESMQVFGGVGALVTVVAKFDFFQRQLDELGREAKVGRKKEWEDKRD